MTRGYCLQSAVVCFHRLPELGGVIDRFWNLARKRIVVIFCFNGVDTGGWGGGGHLWQCDIPATSNG